MNYIQFKKNQNHKELTITLPPGYRLELLKNGKLDMVFQNASSIRTAPVCAATMTSPSPSTIIDHNGKEDSGLCPVPCDCSVPAHVDSAAAEVVVPLVHSEAEVTEVECDSTTEVMNTTVEDTLTENVAPEDAAAEETAVECSSNTVSSPAVASHSLSARGILGAFWSEIRDQAITALVSATASEVTSLAVNSLPSLAVSFPKTITGVDIKEMFMDEEMMVGSTKVTTALVSAAASEMTSLIFD